MRREVFMIKMMPIGPLMIEHRLIERMIGVMGRTSFSGSSGRKTYRRSTGGSWRSS
jgi:hypothetical protein